MGTPVAPDSWRGFDRLSPTVQANLRHQPLFPEGSPLQPPNVRANDVSGDSTADAQGEATVAAWNQYVVVVWFDAKARNESPPNYPDAYIGYATSCDFGATFTDGGSPPRLAANDLPYQGEVAVDDAGTFYLAANYGVNLDASGNWGQDVNVVYAGHFTGCAFAWDPPVIASTATEYFDMPYIATSPVPGTLHIVESRYAGGLATVEVVTSTDGGATWGAPVAVSAPGRIDDPSIATGPNGEVYVTYLNDWWGFYQCDLSSPNWYIDVEFSRSLDGGATFSSPARIAYKTNNLRLNTGPGVWRGWDVTPTDIAVDKSGGPRNGAIYVTWQESGAWPAPVETGNYVTEAEPNDNPATALTVSLGDSAVGTSSPGESDYWRFSLTQGQSAIMRLEPDDFSCANNSTAQRYVLRLYSDPADPNIAPPDTLLAYSNTGVWIQQIVFTAHKTGDYYLRVLHVSGSTSGYTLRTAGIAMGPNADTPARDEGDIVAVVSTDGGAAFSNKVLVSGDAPAGLREDFPCVAVDGTGTAWFSWFDRRETDTTPGAVNTAQLTDVYMRGSDDLLTTFSPGERITDESSTNSGFPHFGIIFGYNDFHGLWADGGHLMAAWGDQRGSNAATSHFDAYTNFLDLEPPTAAFETSPAESGYVAASPVPFEWTGMDRKSATGSLEYATELDGGGYGAYSPDTTASVGVSEGWHAFAVRARDEAGNQGDPAVLDFALDLTPPSVSITTGPGEGQAVVTSDVGFAWSGSDNLSPGPDLEYAYQVDGGGFTSWDPATTANLTGLGLGSHAFELQVRDLSGRTAQITRNFSVDNAVRWNVDASGDWGTGSNWNTGTVPAAADSVVIDRAGASVTVTVSSGSQAAASLYCTEALQLTGGSLSLGGDSQVSDLTLNGNLTFSVAGDLLVSSGLTWNGGTMSGAGTTTLDTGTTSSLASGANRILDGRTLVNLGTVNWSTDFLYVDNNGTFDNQGVLSISGSLNHYLQSSVGQTGNFSNSGTVQITDSHTFSVLSSITTGNTGLFSIDAGTVDFRGPATLDGNFDVAPGATLNFTSGDQTFPASASLVSAGTVSRTGAGTTTIQGNLDITSLSQTGGTFNLSHADTIPNVTLNGNLTLSVAGDLLVSSGLTWNAGTMSGAGTTTLDAGTSNTFGGGAYARILDGRTLVNLDTVDWVGNNIYVDNNGTFDNQGVLSISGSSNRYLQSSAGQTGNFSNSGTVQKTGSHVLTVISSITTDNTGPFSIDAGTVDFQGPAILDGNFNVAPGATLDFSYGDQTFPASSSLVSAGTVSRTGGGTTTIQGNLDITSFSQTGGTFNLSHADTIPDVTLNGNLTFSVAGDLLASNVSLNGSLTFAVAGDLLVSGGLTWQAATMSGAGTTTLDTGTVNSFGGGAYGRILDGRTLVNLGTVNWPSNNINVDNNGIFDNQGVLSISGSSNRYLQSSAGQTGNFSNGGTVQKTGSHVLTVLSSITTSNTGLFEIDAGTLQIDGPFANFSANALSGGMYQVTGTFRFQNADIVTNAADIVLDGTNSQIQNTAAGDALANLALNDSTASLSLLNGKSLITGGFQNAGSMGVGPGCTLDVAGSYTQTAGTTTLGDAANLNATGGVDIQAGALGGTGTVGADLQNAGVVSPGASPGTLAGTGTYTQLASGRLNLEIGGTSPGGTDLLQIGGSAAFAGSLDVILVNGFVPSVGDTFTLAEYGSGSGSFDYQSLPSLPSDRLWSVDQGATQLRLAVAVNDTTPPTVSFIGGPNENQVVVGGDATLEWTAVDDNTPRPSLEFAYRMDGGGYSPWSADSTASYTGLAVGPHVFDVQARDSQGNIGSATRNFQVDDAVRWNVDASGDWGTGSNWNTGTVPTASDSVVIDRPSGTYTVTVSGGDQTARTVTCEENLALVNGFLTVSGDLVVHAGLSLAGGRLVGATILSGPATVATYSSGPTLNGVVLGLELSPAVANAGLYVENGLTLQGATVNLSGAASLIFLGSQTVGGTGEIVFTDDNPVNMIRNNAGGDVLTVGPGVTIHGQQGQIMTSNDLGYLVNQGTIRGDVASGTGISIWRLVSSSNLIEATDGGRVQIVSGTWSNTGTLRAQNSGTLDLGGAVTTAGLGTWEGATGTVRLTGTLDNAGDTFTVSDATGSPVLYGDSSRISGGTVQATGSAGLLYQGGTLDGVTLAAPMSQGIANAILNVENDLTLQAGTVNIGQGSAVVFKGGNQAMGGTGEVVFADGSSANQIRGNAVDDTLTVAGGVTIRGERGTVMSNGAYGYLVNQGTIRADVPSGSGGIALWNLVSTSDLIEADGGTAQILSGTWTNTGTLRAQNGGNLALGGAVTTAGLGTWEGVTGSIFLTGTLDNTGDTYVISDATGSPVLFSQGRIIGGTVQATGSAALLYQGGTLDGVTLAGAASPASPSSVLSVENGVTLQGGTVNIGQGAIVALKGTQTVGGTGEIVFTDGNATNQIRGNAASDTVTVASGITIHGQRGTVMSSADYGYLVNEGDILADVADATGISIWKLVSTSNLVEADGGGTVQILSGTWTNTGTLRAQNGGTLDAGGSTTTAGLGTWEGVSGTIRLTGALDNTGDTFTVSDATGSPVLYGNASITGGSVQATGSARLLYQGGTLDGVTLAGPASPAASGSYLHVASDLALQAGTVNLGQGSQLIFQGSLRLGGTGDIVFTDGDAANQIRGDNPAAGDSLIIGSGVTVRGESGTIQYDTSAAYFLNQGTIRADVASGSGITLGVTQVESQGTLEATNGGTLQCAGVLATSGTVHVGDGSSIFLQNLLNFVTGGEVIVDATGTLLLTSSPIAFSGGVLRGFGTLDGSVSNESLISPGASPGTLTITGGLGQTGSGSILAELGGSDPASYDRLLIGQTATLAGTLDVALTDGFTPAPEDTFTVLEYASLSGAFDQINFPALPGGMEWMVNPGATAFQLITSAGDSIPPVTALVTAPPDMGWIAQDSVYVSWTATDDRSSPEAMLYSYELDGGGATPFTVADTSATFTGLAAGPHTFSVTSRDEAGNTDPTPVVTTFTVDLTAPSVLFASGPEEGATADTADVVFTWHGSDDLAPEDTLEFAYQLDGGGFSPFASDTMGTFNGLAEGPHSVDVKSRDLAGNESTPAGRSFFVDLAAPVVTFTAGPAEGGYLDTAGVALAWTAVDAVAPRDTLEFATQLDGGSLSAFGPDSTADLAGLAEGPHAFLVQARDPVGHVGSALRNFTVDLTPPVVSQTAGPMNGGYADSMVAFGWSGTDNLAAAGDLLYAYQLDGSGYSAEAAVTTVTFHNLSPGPHTFDVRPTDPAGNTGVPLSISFEVDVLDPETAITAGPAEGDTVSVASASFDFTGTDDKSPVDSLRFAYRVDAGSYSPFSLTASAALSGLADGSHTFEVKARDLAGNEDPSPAARTFIVDATAPSVAFTGGPVEDEQVNVTAVDFAWTGSDAVTARNDLEFATSVDQGTLGPWTADSTASLTSLSEGLHSFEVRARDLAGHEGAVVRHYRVDLTAPFVDPPTAQVKDEAKVRFTLTANDVGGVQSFHVQVAQDITFSVPVLETTLVSASPATLDFQGSYGNTYYARTLATDIAGNQSGYSDHSNGAVISQQPDLLVTQVQAPSTAYSGQSMLVTWTVADSGLGGTNVPQWSDRIYLSPTPTLDLGTAVVLGTTQNLTYLNVNESYTNQGIFTLPNGISGTFYAIVVTDVLDNLSESDAGNNLGASSPVDVSLSASADLQVTALSVPTNAFSGDPITVSWTVQNLGTGRTDVDNWYDTVFLSPDPSFDYTLSSGSIKFLDRPLGRLQHVGALDPDTTYNAVLQVTIPPEVSGTQYLFVWSDINVTQSGVYVGERGNVFENVGELNNAGGLSDNIAVTLTPPADLVVDSFTAPSTAASGQVLSLSWTVKNTGLNPTFENFWNDRVYMSTDDQFGGDALVATVGHNGVLDRDSTYTAGAQIPLSPSLSGSRWFFVVTDGTGLALELDETNNTSAGAMTDISLSPWPDLVVTSVVAQDSADAGSSIPVSWRVQNQGAGALPSGTWSDRIYLSGSPTFDPNTATLLKEITVSAATGNVHGTTVTLSSSLNGAYYLFAVADSRQNVFENTDEGNNVSPAKTLQVVPHGAVDLAVDNLSVPGTLYSGGTFPVSWTVTNLGAGRTLVSSWGEQVYLSTDDVLSPSTDLQVLGISHSGGLDPGSAYTQNKQFTVPNGFSGDYYVLVVTAPGGSGTGDVDLTNNTVASPAPITVGLTPAPDLAVSSVQATGTPLAGQSVRVHWTVDNLGSGPPVPADWTMSVYLSQDPLLGGDLHLGSRAGGGSLAPAASYEDSMDVELPSYISGPYYLVVKADDQNRVYEAGAEGNNTLSTPVNITFPAPADLAVTGVTGPATATPGDPVTVTWTVANVGGNTATGVFREAVYVSLDSEFVSTEDPLVGIVERSIDLAPGASIEMEKQITLSQAYLADLAGNITRTLPGIPPGDYYFLVRTNIRANIRELDFDNNLGHTDLLTTVDVPVLTIDVPETFPLGDTQSSYWRIPAPSDLDMSVTVSSDEIDATNELFVAFNRPPALNDFDFTGPAEFTANPSLLIPSTQAGDYYVLVRTRALPLGSTTQNITLKAHAVPFSITSITPDAGGTQGEVSCTLRGAGFRDSTQVHLGFANNLQIHPVETTFINTTELRLRWNLSGVPEATYDVVAMNGAQAVTLPSGFRVEAPLDLRLEATAVHPDVIRDNSTGYFTFKYRNAANWNVPYARIRVVYPASANLVSLSTGDKLYSRSELLPGSTVPVSGDVYAAADSATGSSLEVLDLLAVDTAPGEEVVCTLGLKEFPGSPFSVRAFSEILDTGSFLNSEAARIEAVRNAVLLDPGSYFPATVVLAADADAFRDSALTRTYVDRGLLSADQLAVYSVTGFGSRVQATAPMSADRSWLDRIRFSALDATPPESCLVTSPTPGCVPDIDPVGTVLPDCAVCFDAQVSVGYLLPEEVLVPVPGGLCENMSPDIDADAKVVSPCDPNQITGPAGYGDASWISSVQASFYTIDFENLSETASAPAQVVTVQVPLDPGFDVTSFRLGAMGFGNNVVSVPAGASSYTNEQYYSDIGLVVRIVAGVDILTRTAFWTFTSLDPNTGEPPTNPYVGFLPVNDPLGRGQGFVTYTVSPAPGAATGTVVGAQAEITFDTNPALSTNLASNTLDAGIPSSAVVSASPVDPTTYDLQWTGNDPASGSGLRDFTLYVSQDSGPFLLLQGSLEGSLYRFTGETGHVYGFFTLARDNSGNIEPVKTQPEEEVGVGMTGTPDDRTPLRLGLLQNSPNPFRLATMVRFTMPEKGRVTLNIFNVAGRLVRSVYDGDLLPAGAHEVEIRSDGLASGVYFYRLQVGDKRFTRKMLLVH